MSSKFTLSLPHSVVRRRLEGKRRQLAAELLFIGPCCANEIRDFPLAAGEERDRKHLLLRDVVDALARLTAGKYGFCVQCGTGISAERLYAVPWTPHCLHCQEVAERDRRRASKSAKTETDVCSRTARPHIHEHSLGLHLITTPRSTNTTLTV